MGRSRIVGSLMCRINGPNGSGKVKLQTEAISMEISGWFWNT